MLFFTCQEKQKESHLTVSNNDYWIDKWTEVEVMSHKYIAEKKWNDNFNCFVVSPNLDTTKIDSLLHYWSIHPNELEKIIETLISQKLNQ